MNYVRAVLLVAGLLCTFYVLTAVVARAEAPACQKLLDRLIQETEANRQATNEYSNAKFWLKMRLDIHDKVQQALPQYALMHEGIPSSLGAEMNRLLGLIRDEQARVATAKNKMDESSRAIRGLHAEMARLGCSSSTPPKIIWTGIFGDAENEFVINEHENGTLSVRHSFTTVGENHALYGSDDEFTCESVDKTHAGLCSGEGEYHNPNVTITYKVTYSMDLHGNALKAIAHITETTPVWRVQPYDIPVKPGAEFIFYATRKP